MTLRRKMHLRRLVGGRERRCQVGKLARLTMVAVLLAVAMLSSAGVASADNRHGHGGKNPPARTSGITWE